LTLRKKKPAALLPSGESGGARVAVTLTIVPKDIEARILIAYRKTVNRFLKKVFLDAGPIRDFCV
jgi:hypothetical protein